MLIIIADLLFVLRLQCMRHAPVPGAQVVLAPEALAAPVRLRLRGTSCLKLPYHKYALGTSWRKGLFLAPCLPVPFLGRLSQAASTHRYLDPVISSSQEIVNLPPGEALVFVSAVLP